jgi:triosephosphate isomerase
MLIVANWKTYVEDSKKAKKLVEVSKRLARATSHTIVLAPPAPFLAKLAANNKSKVAFSAQDVSVTTGGAQTGEATAAMFASAGASYAIIGHSERRALGDTNSIVAEKLSHVLSRGLTPILCVGEHERDSEGRYLTYIREEITTALSMLIPKERIKIVIAYEPLWAIGKTATSAIGPSDLAEMVLYIRKVLFDLIPGKHSTHAFILYGGSVEPDNIHELAKNSGINGFLIGHASVEPSSFSLLVKHL